MRELTITLSVSTERDDQEVVDMLIDGFINMAGDLSQVSVNGRKYGIDDTVFTIGNGTTKLNLGTRKASQKVRRTVSRKHKKRDGDSISGSTKEIQSNP